MKINNLLFITVFLPLIFSAQDGFKLAVESPDHIQFYIKEVKTNEAWVRMQMPIKKIRSKKTGKLVSTGGDFYLEYWKCDCKEKKYSAESRTLYNINGNVKTTIGDIHSERVLPGSNGEGVLNIICGFEKSLDDLSQEAFNDDVYDSSERLEEYVRGYKIGYKSVYCAPLKDCLLSVITPNEITLAELPENDFVKGYSDGQLKAEKDKR